jgi:hypothetical protein
MEGVMGEDERYRCTCPPTDNDDDEIAQALACWQREKEWNRRRAAEEATDKGE